jgi:hypothetical protein
MLCLQDTSGTTLRNIQVLVMRILSSTNTDSTDSTESQQMLPSVQGYCRQDMDGHTDVQRPTASAACSIMLHGG